MSKVILKIFLPTHKIMKMYINFQEKVRGDFVHDNKMKHVILKILSNIIDKCVIHIFNIEPDYYCDQGSLILTWNDHLDVKIYRFNDEILCDLRIDTLIKSFRTNRSRELTDISNILFNLIKFVEF